MYNKRQFKKTNDKKVLHKIGKSWKVISLSLLMAIGGTAVATHANANAANVNTANGDNHTETNVNTNQMSANHSTLVKPQSMASSNAQQSNNTSASAKSVSPNSVSAKATSIADNVVSAKAQNNNNDLVKNSEISTSEASSAINHIKSDSAVASSYFNKLRPEASNYSAEIISGFTSDKNRSINSNTAVSTTDSLAEMFSLSPYTASGSNLVLPELSKASSDYTSSINSCINKVESKSASVSANPEELQSSFLPLLGVDVTYSEANYSADSLTQNMKFSYSNALSAFDYPRMFYSIRPVAYSAFSYANSVKNNSYIKHSPSTESSISAIENDLITSGKFLFGNMFKSMSSNTKVEGFIDSEFTHVPNVKDMMRSFVPKSFENTISGYASMAYSSMAKSNYNLSYAISVNASYSASYASSYANSVNASYSASYSASVSASYVNSSANAHVNNDVNIAYRYASNYSHILNKSENARVSSDRNALKNELLLSNASERVSRADHDFSDIMNTMYYPIYEHKFDWNNPSVPTKLVNTPFQVVYRDISGRIAVNPNEGYSLDWTWHTDRNSNTRSSVLPKGVKGIWFASSGTYAILNDSLNKVDPNAYHISNAYDICHDIPAFFEYADGSVKMMTPAQMGMMKYMKIMEN